MVIDTFDFICWLIVAFCAGAIFGIVLRTVRTNYARWKRRMKAKNATNMPRNA